MGWTGFYPTIDAAIADELEGFTILERAKQKRGAWLMVERNGKRFIVLAIYEGRCIKTVDESMGPLEYDCPRAWLDKVPDPGGFATTWRKKVRGEIRHAIGGCPA